jgi:hypothetical protein
MAIARHIVYWNYGDSDHNSFGSMPGSDALRVCAIRASTGVSYGHCRRNCSTAVSYGHCHRNCVVTVIALRALGGDVYVHGEFLAGLQEFVFVYFVPAGDLVDAYSEFSGDEVEGIAVSYCVAEFSGGVA